MEKKSYVRVEDLSLSVCKMGKKLRIKMASAEKGEAGWEKVGFVHLDRLMVTLSSIKNKM